MMPWRLRRVSSRLIPLRPSFPPEFQDEHVHRIPQKPTDPPQTPGRGFATQSAVDGTERKSGGVDQRLDEGRECIRFIYTRSSRDAVAEEQHPATLGG